MIERTPKFPFKNSMLCYGWLQKSAKVKINQNSPKKKSSIIALLQDKTYLIK